MRTSFISAEDTLEEPESLEAPRSLWILQEPTSLYRIPCPTLPQRTYSREDTW